MNEENTIHQVQQELSGIFELPAYREKTDFVNHLSIRINELILHDFHKLVMILYRIDINEAQLKSMLQQYQHTDAGYIIAQLIIDRQLQKAESRKNFRREENIPDEDKW